jgi:hypothetical protein
LLGKDILTYSEVTVITTEIKSKQAPIILEKVKVPERIVVYDNMTMDELAAKLEKSMYGILSGKGYTYANYAIQYGVDPYVALAITLHETGCKWGCSYLANTCNNIGGMKGTNPCGNTGYARFNTLEEGIESFFSNLSYNYYDSNELNGYNSLLFTDALTDGYTPQALSKPSLSANGVLVNAGNLRKNILREPCVLSCLAHMFASCHFLLLYFNPKYRSKSVPSDLVTT